jgi:hypothetical protein
MEVEDVLMEETRPSLSSSSFNVGRGSWFRSEEMEYVSLLFPEDDCYRCLARLARLDALQFVDVILPSISVRS